MTLRERLMTVYRGGLVTPTPVTIYNWINLPEPAAGRLHARGLTWIGSRLLFRLKYRNMSVDTREFGAGAERRKIVQYTTPVGTLTEATAFDPTVGSPWIQEHMIKTVEDYAIMKYIVDHTDYEPEFDAWGERERALGQGGILLGEIDPSPLVWMMVKVMGTATWAEGMMENTEAFDELHDAILQGYKKQVELAAGSPAEVVWLPDNITGSVVSPRVFVKYMTPVYEYSCSTLRQAGKLTFAHYDGANKLYTDVLGKTKIDIIEAFTPPPMGDMTVGEARAAWPGKVLSLNFPGNLLSQPDEVVARHARQYMKEGGDRRAFVMGCTEDFDVSHFERAFSILLDVSAEFT